MEACIALICTIIITADCLTGGHLGLKKALVCLLKNKSSRWFTIMGLFKSSMPAGGTYAEAVL